MKQLFAIVLTCLLLSSCGQDSSKSNSASPNITIDWQPKSSEWQTVDSQTAGFNQDKLNVVFQNAAATNSMLSLLIVKDNKLLAEAYFQGENNTRLFHERSVTKTVIAMLIGIAIEQGFIANIDQQIGDYFLTDYPDLTIEKQNITIRHLLTMTSGFNWDESESSGYTSWANAHDPQYYLLNRNLVSPAGESFSYNSAAVHLLSAIITKATHKSTLAFAMENLFTPLAIKDIQWEKLQDGIYNGGAGLQLKSADLAKIGQLLLDNGLWQGQQIIPHDWLLQAKSQQVTLNSSFGVVDQINYGYLWWLGHGNSTNFQLAWGWGGQFIITITDKNMVIVCNSTWQKSLVNHQEKAALNIMIHGVIDAINS